MMDEQSGMVVGLDFSDEAKRNEMAELLRFANLTIGETPHVDVVLGDGTQAAAFANYVHLRLADAAPPVTGVWADCHLSSLLSAFSQARCLRAGQQASAEELATTTFVGISGESQSVREDIVKAAPSDVTVLITGESGTGKEVVARALHRGSQRAQGPFVPINCGAIPAELLESELFGHDKGAFTGAITNKAGRFELAHGGTLFLDEIGDLPFAMQVKLLRAIEQKSFERVGSAESRIADVRIVAATNNDLEAKIEAGEFREDLYYRLNVYPIEIPPLRERVEDLTSLTNVLVEKIRQQQGLLVRFSVEALAALAAYSWPGNVRELDNLLQRLAIQYPNGLVKVEDLPRKYTDAENSPEAPQSANATQTVDPTEVLLPINGIDLKDYLTRLERSLIEQALEDTNSVVARAADRLHIRRTTLVEKMRKHGLGRLDQLQ